jgi:hypothetical protein
MKLGNAVGIEAAAGDFPALRFALDDSHYFAALGLQAALLDCAVDSGAGDA